MPNYKKKRRSRLFTPQRKSVKPQKRSKTEDIVMTPKKEPKPEKSDNIRVIKGRKNERKRKFKSLMTAFGVLLILIFLLETFLPSGIVQTLSNGVALLGTGTYPISVSGTKTLDVVSVNNYYFNLTDTHLSAYSSAGKELFSSAHGFEKPILKVSKGRALLIDQGGKQFHIYDLNELKKTVETENEIICGAISDSGNFAVATYSDNYASAVTVYDKRYKTVFEWYSAEDTINNVEIAPNGKKIAVSTFNSSSGVLNSKVNVINFKSATPEHSKTLDNALVYGLNCSNNRGFFLIKSKGVEFIKWSNFESIDFSDGYNISLLRNCGNRIVAVFCRENDKTDNKIVLFSKSGKVKNTVNHKGIINDIKVKGNNIYTLGDSEVSVLDFEGNLKFAEGYGFGGNGLIVSSANTAVVVKDNEIIKIKFNEKE